jgi:ribonuclease HI
MVLSISEICNINLGAGIPELTRSKIEEDITYYTTLLKEKRANGLIEDFEYNKILSKFNSIRSKFKNQRLSEGLLEPKEKILYLDNSVEVPTGHQLIYFDGSTSTNPGGFSVGGCILHRNNKTYTHYLTQENSTNNVAEYLGLIAAFELALQLKLKNIYIKGDSQVVIKQLTGEYRQTKEDLRLFYNRAIKLKNKFESVLIYFIPRVFNKEADKFVYSKMKELTRIKA